MKLRYWLYVITALFISSCSPEGDEACSIRDLIIEVGDCTSDSTYTVTVSFIHENAGNALFDVFVRDNQLIGTYPLSSLPLTIADFPISGRANDFIRICINDNPECCVVTEFLPPDCEAAPCSISSLTATPGDCQSDSTYKLNIDFDVTNPGNASFDVFVRNNVFMGNYPLSSLPLSINNFKKSGLTYDLIKVCINDNPDCCKVVEFLSPTCATEPCSITNLVANKGACTSDSTYSLTLNFTANNPGNAGFDVFVRNNVFVGYYKLSDLPITPNFKVSGKPEDFVRVCINDNPDCCKAIEFPTKNCR
jgi:hypothetical protein